MSIEFIGKKFQIDSPWGRQEHYILKKLRHQYDAFYPDQKQLIISLTWYFSFTHDEVEKLIEMNKTYDRIIWCSVSDPIPAGVPYYEISKRLGATDVLFYGSGFDIGVNTGVIACYDEFDLENYSEDQVILKQIENVYINYNRKPRPHRIRMVEGLIAAGLEQHGVITIGAADVDYDITEGIEHNLVLTIEGDTPEDYLKCKNGDLPIDTNFGRVPYDILSLGKMNIWRGHFLNVVSETICAPWEPTFVTEKTWKPIVGMRPFVINGQPDVYNWLRTRGFRTFEKYYYGIELENLHENHIQTNIVQLVKKFCECSHDQLMEIYNDMYDDLLYNRNRFFEYAQEEINNIENLDRNVLLNANRPNI